MAQPLRTALVALLLSLGSTAAFGQDPRLGWQEPGIRQGVSELQAGQWDASVKSLKAVIDRDPDKYVAWFYLGMAHHSAGRMDEALKAHMMTAALAPPTNSLRSVSLYNAACAHALSGRSEQAFRYLHRARNAGFVNGSQIAQDSDFASLSDDPRMKVFASNPSIAPADPQTGVDSLTGLVQGGTGGVELAPDGTLYIADFGNTVWKMTADGERSVFARGFTKAADCTLDRHGNLIQVDFGASTVTSIAPDGTMTDLKISGLNGPVGVDQGDDGTLYLTSFNDQAIVTYAPDGTMKTLSQGWLINGPNGIALAPDGMVYVVNYHDGSVIGLESDGTQRLIAELPGGGNGHVAWSNGALYITARKGHQVYRVTPEGAVAIVSGSGAPGVGDGSGATAQHSLPNGIAVDEETKRLYLNDTIQGAGQFVVRRVTLP